MRIEEVDIRELKPYANNPRTNDDSVRYVMNSIKEFGFKVPIVIDDKKEIIAGHTRYKASKELGLKTVPCIIADDLTEEQVKAFRLADNKVSELSTWDWDKLNLELDDIVLDMKQFNFIVQEIDLDFNDEDFVQDTEITKNRDKKVIKCPYCGEEIEI